MVGRTQKWISTLIDSLNDHVDEKTRTLILEQCGRQCQSRSFIQKAKKICQRSADFNEFVDKLGTVYKHLHREGDRVYLIYPKCYCSQVNKIPRGRLSGTYCNCSRGWAKALFEGVTGKPVEVTLQKSIINGDEECRFRIDV